MPTLDQVEVSGQVLRAWHKPKCAVWGWLALGLFMLAAVFALFGEWGQVAAVALVCGALLPATLWAGLTRSGLWLTVDFESETVEVAEIRMFESRLAWQGSLAEVAEIRVEGDTADLIWHDPDAGGLVFMPGEHRAALLKLAEAAGLSGPG